MKSFTPFSICLFFILSSYLSINVYGSPLSKRQDQTSSIVIQSPTKDDTWVIGSTEAITWKSTGNDPIDILLSKESSSEVIVVAQGLNSFQGSYVATVPTSIKLSNGSKWKVVIKNNGQIFSNSDYFAIADSAPPSSSSSVDLVPPSPESLAQNHWSATASISVLGPDGKALSLSSWANRASFFSLWTLLASVITTCLFVCL